MPQQPAVQHQQSLGLLVGGVEDLGMVNDLVGRQAVRSLGLLKVDSEVWDHVPYEATDVELDTQTAESCGERFNMTSNSDAGASREASPAQSRRSPDLASHVQAAIASGLQPKATPQSSRPLASHVQRAVQAGLQPKPQPPTSRVLAAHVKAALSVPSSTASPPVTHSPQMQNARSVGIQPCSRFWSWLTDCFPGQAGGEEPLLELGVVETGSPVSRRAAPPMVSLGQGVDGLITYGSQVMNLSTTTCGLVILHTEGAQAVGYHWPFCNQSRDYEAAFEQAVGNRDGTSIEVVVNGGRYSSGDSAPKDFGSYLRRLWRLPVTVYRQVVQGGGRNDPDPWVVVERGGVRAPVEGYELVKVQL